MPFSKVLVANRGEIAIRVMRGAKALGYETVAVFSEVDRDAPFVQAADEAYEIGPAAVRQSYLDAGRILDAAQATGADAIHPGYGFLSENAAFAEACTARGVTFIGPSPHAIRVMGDKRLAKEQAIAAGVPCAPGYMGNDQSPAVIVAAARKAGLPLLIKASAGGGGRGMRIVRDFAELETSLASARSEAQNAFGDGTLYLERLVENARHIEIQVFADQHGNVVHLGERECSLQRRHQKIIEEAPSPAIDAALREKLGAAAVSLAREIGYVGAGTIEFLVEASGAFWFLEMNTRLQVEHPVTELVTGLDLVKLQLRVAAGEPLPFMQSDLRITGHAIEARVYAEDPFAGYAPQVGRLLAWKPAEGEGIRFDAGVTSGFEVTSHYDPLLAKAIAYGANRGEALRRMRRALSETVILGPRNNREFLVDLLDDPVVRAGNATTDYLDTQPPRERKPSPDWLIAAAALLLCIPQGTSASEWRELGTGRWRLLLDGAGDPIAVTLTRTGNGRASAAIGDTTHEIVLHALDADRLRFAIGGHMRAVHFSRAGGEVWVQAGAHSLHVKDIARERAKRAGARSGGSVVAPITGRIVSVAIAVGDTVDAEQPIAVLEAMKMEMQIRAPRAGRVSSVGVTPGTQISAGHLIAEVETAEATAGRGDP